VARVVGAVFLVVATVAALPDDLMTALVLLVACAAAALLMTRTDLTADVAAGLLPLTFAGLVWSAGQVGEVPDVYRAAPVLVVLGLLAIWRPDAALESSTAAVSVVVAAASVEAAADTSWALALHLTLAGALVTATALVHPSRRSLAGVGGLLLALASWVRLYDLGVHTPEAYTLPSALVLVALGSWRLRRDPGAPTLAVLAPGLGLATVPSLLVALDDPFSPRALLLGLGCLALVLSGVALRWNAPLVVGAVAGALLVLRELAPYAATIPPWLLIGLSGTLLTAVGVTWESRMRDLRTAAGYVGSLR
jgi:cell division protein FtsW (lipid II flippase)